MFKGIRGYWPPKSWALPTEPRDIDRVLSAFDSGYTTSAEISEALKMDVKTASSYLSTLSAEGKIKKDGVKGRYMTYKKAEDEQLA